MRIGITGAGGFIGRHLVDAFAASGHSVVRLSRGPLPGRALETRQFDVEIPNSMPNAFAGLDGLIHAAAFVPASMTDNSQARRCLEINALGTLSTLKAAQAASVRWFALMSGNLYHPSTQLARECDPIYPLTAVPYLASKVCAELYASQFASTCPIAIAIIRPGAVYGFGMRPGLVTRFCSALRAGKPVTVTDGGRYKSDMVFVSDVAQAVVRAAELNIAGTINLGTGQRRSSLEVATILTALFQKPAELVSIEAPLRLEPPPGFPAMDSLRAEKELGFRPRSLESGLATLAAQQAFSQ